MTYQLQKPVFFIGFMGAGKTSVSRYLARTCGLASIDADAYLELQEERSIAEIFAECGEDYFRDVETKYLHELAHQHPCLIGCGGGVVKRSENVATMRTVGYVVYLEATADAAAQRITHTDSRPLFKDLETARAILSERIPLYEAAANVKVNTVGLTTAEVADVVKSALEEAGVLIQVPENQTDEFPSVGEK